MKVNFSSETSGRWSLHLEAESEPESATLRELFSRQPNTLRCTLDQSRGESGVRTWLTIHSPEPSR